MGVLQRGAEVTGAPESPTGEEQYRNTAHPLCEEGAQGSTRKHSIGRAGGAQGRYDPRPRRPRADHAPPTLRRGRRGPGARGAQGSLTCR